MSTKAILDWYVLIGADHSTIETNEFIRYDMGLEVARKIKYSTDVMHYDDNSGMNKYKPYSYINIYRYAMMKQSRKELHDEMWVYLHHPKFIQKYIEEYGMEALDKYLA